jgi:hydrogenase maturation protease
MHGKTEVRIGHEHAAREHAADCAPRNASVSRREETCLVVGVGNPLRRDDGAGPGVVRRLASCSLPPGTALEEREADIFVILEEMHRYGRVIVVDAVDMGSTPGTTRIFAPDEAAVHIRSDTLSTHGFGIRELIAFAEELQVPAELLVAGIQAKDVSFGEGMSGEVKEKLDDLVELITDLL